MAESPVEESLRSALSEVLRCRAHETRVLLLDTTTSTMDAARAALSQEGFDEGEEIPGAADVGDTPFRSVVVVTAREQTAGRGREQRPWFSDRDKGVYLTIGAFIEQPVGVLVGMPLLVGEALVAQLRARYRVRSGMHLGIKWPNDIYVATPRLRKLGGILVESTSSAAGTSVFVGVGLNVVPSELPGSVPAIAAQECFHETATLAEVTALVTAGIFDGIDGAVTGKISSLPLKWPALSILQDRMIELRRGDTIVKGHEVGISREGALEFVRIDGEQELIYHGEILLPDHG